MRRGSAHGKNIRVAMQKQRAITEAKGVKETRQRPLPDLKQIEVKKVKGNPYQTRIFLEEEPLRVLVRSIRERGLFNPITLLKVSKDNYIVIHGHRRLEAVKRLKWKTIPAFVKPKSAENSLITDLIQENLVREDLSVQEKALSIKLLFSQIKSVKDDLDAIISCITAGKTYNKRGRAEDGSGSGIRSQTKWTIDDMFHGMRLLKTIGMSENNAISYLNILKLPAHIQKIVSFNVHNDAGERSSTRISVRMANHVARVDDTDYRDHLLERALTGSSANHIEALVSNYKTKVLKGEWAGYVKKFNNSKVLRGLDKSEFLDISARCKALHKRLNSWRAKRLSALAETLDSEVFIAEATLLRKEIGLLDNKLKQQLSDKGYIDVEKKEGNEVFEMPIKENKDHGGVRGSVPIKVLKNLGFADSADFRDGSFIQMKIVGIRAKDSSG